MKSLEVKIAYLDENYKIIERSKEFYTYFEKTGFLYTNIEDLVLPEQKEEFLDFVKQSRDLQEFRAYRFKKITGEFFYNLVSAGNSELNGKNVLAVHIIDVSNALQFFKEATHSEKILNYALSITNDYFFMYQKSTNMFFLHNFMQNKRIVLYEQDIDSWKELVLKNSVIDENDILIFEQAVDELKLCNERFSASFSCQIRNTRSIYEKMRFTAVRFEDDGEVYMIGRMLPEDLFAQTEKSNELMEELKIDDLTGVYNKKAITNFAEKRFIEGTKEDAALVIVDLDHFKPVNDAYGHLAGDKVLSKAGKVLRKIVGDGGLVGRYGGDEFLLILEDIKDESILRGILYTINADMRSAFENMFSDIKVTASVGSSLYPKDGKSFDELFKKADFCLYRAKDKGRDRYVFFRQDLHGELYKKAIEAKTEGIKYDVLEVLELKSMADFLLNLRSNPKPAVDTVLEHMLKTYNLCSINIFYGEDFKRMYCIGKKSDALQKAEYADSALFKKALDGKPFIRVDFTTELSENARDFGKLLDSRGVKSTIHCILGTTDRILGLITFDRLKEGALWAEYEVNCCVMFAAAMNLLSEDKLQELFISQ